MAEHQTNNTTWIVSRAKDEHVFCGTARLLGNKNANPDDKLNAHLENLPLASSFNSQLNDEVPPNPPSVQCLPEANMDWDINQFFDLDNAALESPTHDPTPADLLCHNSPALQISAQPALNSFSTSSKRPRPASESDGQTDAFAAPNRITTNAKAQTAVHPQSHQSVKHSDSYNSASRVRITPASSLYSGAMTGTLATSLCYGAETMHPGFHCFDWKDQEEKQHDQRPAKKFRKETSKQQREEAKEVRQKGACLRCYVLKLKCSSGYPCNTCKTLFERAHSSRTLQWRACIESSLADINIFTYGCALLSNEIDFSADPFLGFAVSGRVGCIPGRQGPGAKVSLRVVDPSLYKVILRVMEFDGDSSLLNFLDSLYLDILRAQSHLDGSETDPTHAFILEDRNPLHMLLHLNAIIVGSHLLGRKLVGYKEYLLHLRAISGSLAFEGLENCLERTTLANSSITRLLAPIVYISVLLEQVFGVGEHSAASRYVSGDETYTTMQGHLIEYLSCYLRKLSTNVFAPGTAFLTLVKKAPADFIHRASFWEKLSKVTGLSALQTFPKVRQLSKLGHDLSAEESSVRSITEAGLGISIRDEGSGYWSQATPEALNLVWAQAPWKHKVHTWLMSM